MFTSLICLSPFALGHGDDDFWLELGQSEQETCLSPTHWCSSLECGSTQQ